MEAFYEKTKKKSQSWIIMPDVLWTSLVSTKTVALMKGFIFNHISAILTFYITVGDLPKRNVSFYSAELCLSVVKAKGKVYLHV